MKKISWPKVAYYTILYTFAAKELVDVVTWAI